MPILRCLLLLVIPLLSACHPSPGQPAVGIRLQADGDDLRQAAFQALNYQGIYTDNDNPALPQLLLSEQHSEAIESLASDGSVGSYEITYRLTYRLNDEAAQTIILSEVVDYNENRYRAGRAQIGAMVGSMRGSALTQMLIGLKIKL